MKVYAISYRDKGCKQVKQVVPHVLLITADDDQAAWPIAKRKVKEMEGDLRTMKWVGSTIPLLFSKSGECYYCHLGSIDDGGHV